MRVYLPPDANTLLSVTDHCLRSRNYVNVVVAGKQPEPQWLNMDRRSSTARRASGIWEWASNDRGGEPDVVMACCGDVPTLETLAAVEILRKKAPELEDPRRQRRGPDDAAAAERASARAVATGTSTRCSPPTSRSSSPSTAIRGSSTASPIGGRITTTSTSAATRRRGRPPRRSICACSTTSTVSTWSTT